MLYHAWYSAVVRDGTEKHDYNYVIFIVGLYHSIHVYERRCIYKCVPTATSNISHGCMVHFGILRTSVGNAGHPSLPKYCKILIFISLKLHMINFPDFSTKIRINLLSDLIMFLL